MARNINLNFLEIHDKHGRMLKKNGLNIEKFNKEDQEITYDKKADIYRPISVIPQAKKIGELEEKLEIIIKNRFEYIKKEEVEDLARKVERIEKEFGIGSFEKMKEFKKYSTYFFTSGFLKNKEVKLYLVRKGTGIFFGDKKELPKLNNIELINGEDDSRVAQYFINNGQMKVYDNGADFNRFLYFCKDLYNGTADHADNIMVNEQWDYDEKAKELEEKMPKIKDICSTDKNRKIETLGEFRNILSEGKIHAYEANNFYSIISGKDIKLGIPKDFFYKYDEGEKIHDYLSLTGQKASHNVAVDPPLDFWAMGKRLDSVSIEDLLGFPYIRKAPVVKPMDLCTIPVVFSRHGKINIECASPDVVIIHPGIKLPLTDCKHRIYAFSGKDKIKVKYTDGRKY